jgi:hypothetical protein
MVVEQSAQRKAHDIYSRLKERVIFQGQVTEDYMHNLS